MDIRSVVKGDAAELVLLLNEIINQGGTTALEDPCTEEGLLSSMLIGSNIHSCFVAIEPITQKLVGFQAVVSGAGLPPDVGDIATFARVGVTQKGIGSSLFIETRIAASKRGLRAINATIRADNVGGLAFYNRMGFVDYAVRLRVPLKDGTPVDRVSKSYSVVKD